MQGCLNTKKKNFLTKWLNLNLFINFILSFDFTSTSYLFGFSVYLMTLGCSYKHPLLHLHFYLLFSQVVRHETDMEEGCLKVEAFVDFYFCYVDVTGLEEWLTKWAHTIYNYLQLRPAYQIRDYLCQLTLHVLLQFSCLRGWKESLNYGFLFNVETCLPH
jgi:hypothetical protein